MGGVEPTGGCLRNRKRAVRTAGEKAGLLFEGDDLIDLIYRKTTKHAQQHSSPCIHVCHVCRM
jgi:hypothetical protein